MFATLEEVVSHRMLAIMMSFYIYLYLYLDFCSKFCTVASLLLCICYYHNFPLGLMMQLP